MQHNNFPGGYTYIVVLGNDGTSLHNPGYAYPTEVVLKIPMLVCLLSSYNVGHRNQLPLAFYYGDVSLIIVQVTIPEALNK